MQKFRAPKLVQEEAATNTGEIASRIASPLSIEDVMEIRTSWNGENGKSWANRITGDMEERASILLKGVPMEKRDDGAPDTAADLFTVIETAVDALKDLLGIVDDEQLADPNSGDMEMNSGDKPTVEVRTDEESQMIEERKSAIETADKFTIDAEIRAIPTEDGSLKIGGYAVRWNTEADGLPFREMFAPNAFTRSLEGSEPIFLLTNHQYDQFPLASTRSGTLRLTQDAIGLSFEADLDSANPRSAELASALSRGDVNKMSFSFKPNKGGEQRQGDLRVVTDARLFEISPVNTPAYSSTDVSMRNAGDETRAAELFQSQLKLKLQLLSLNK